MQAATAILTPTSKQLSDTVLVFVSCVVGIFAALHFHVSNQLISPRQAAVSTAQRQGRHHACTCSGLPREVWPAEPRLWHHQARKSHASAELRRAAVLGRQCWQRRRSLPDRACPRGSTAEMPVSASLVMASPSMLHGARILTWLPRRLPLECYN